jgi:hypothetical protein
LSFFPDRFVGVARRGHPQVPGERYSSKAVIESRKQMNENDGIHKPVIEALQLGVTRTVMRVIDSIPILKRRVKHSRTAEDHL